MKTLALALLLAACGDNIKSAPDANFVADDDFTLDDDRVVYPDVPTRDAGVDAAECVDTHMNQDGTGHRKCTGQGHSKVELL